MPLFPRAPLGAVLRAGLLAAVAACCLTLTVSRRGDFWAAPWPDGGADPSGGQEPEACVRDILRRAAAKQRLAVEVIEGRLSLVEAATRFRDLDEQPPPFHWQAFRDAFPGASDDERHCRQVLNYVWGELQDRPDADPALLGRLEAELQDLLARGNFRLPRPDPPPAARRWDPTAGRPVSKSSVRPTTYLEARCPVFLLGWQTCCWRCDFAGRSHLPPTACFGRRPCPCSLNRLRRIVSC
jgi:hypothetical protein